MKKTWILLMTILALVTLAACSPAATKGVTPTQAPATSAPATSAPATETASATASATPVPTATPTPAPTSTLSPTPAPTPSATSGVTEKAMGLIKKIYQKDKVYYIDIDYVQFLTGDEAIQQALNDKSDWLVKNDDGTYSLPNDYYISNTNKKIRTFPISADCDLKVIDYNDNLKLKKVDIKKFIASFKKGSSGLVSISVKDGVAVDLEEFYTP